MRILRGNFSEIDTAKATYRGESNEEKNKHCIYWGITYQFI